MELTFEKQSFSKRLRSMIKVDLKRMFTMPLVYIMLGVCLVIPILTIVMTSMFSGMTTVDPTTGVENTMEGFTNAWQAIGSTSNAEMSMDITSMCNINLIYFIIAIFICLFVSEDFRSGYVKNLFTVRSDKRDYVISKSIVGIVGGIGMLLVYFVGAMLGGKIAGLSFEMVGFNISNLIMCMLSKIVLVAVFISIYLVLSVVGKHRVWLSILGSFGVGMLMFMMIPMMTPLDATIMHVIMCLAGGVLFSFGLGVVSNLILKKTSLI